MKKVLLIFLALAVVCCFIAAATAADKGKSETVNGWVSDSKCTVKGTSSAHAACAKKCIGAGEKAAPKQLGTGKTADVHDAELVDDSDHKG